jgi:hypothetical protein
VAKKTALNSLTNPSRSLSPCDTFQTERTAHILDKPIHFIQLSQPPCQRPRATSLPSLPKIASKSIKKQFVHTTPIEKFLVGDGKWERYSRYLQFLLTGKQVYNEAASIAFARTISPIYNENVSWARRTTSFQVEN